MRTGITSLLLYVTFGPTLLLAQAVSGAAPEIPPAMDERGPPLAKDLPGVAMNLSAAQLRDAGSDLPLARLSQIAQQPIAEIFPPTRTAKDAQLYRTASPSVVLIATKEGLGSGSLIGPFGDVLTNWHVVSGHTEVGVVFKPATEGQVPTKEDIRTGFVVKMDEIADLALVKVADPPTGGSFLRLGDSSEISVGLDVHAIGHPVAGRWTYTKGIISQYRLGFEWPGENGTKHKADLIQTQTPINPGNSGGPLISESGTLLGVNTFKAEGEGLNFAISVDDVKKFIARSGSRLAEVKSGAIGGPPPEPECRPREVSRWRSKENDATILGYDLTCKGPIDAEYVYPDDLSKAILFKVDRNRDWRADVMFFDLKRRGKWDLSWWDENFDGHWTLVGYHDDGSLKPSRFESYEAYRKRRATAAEPRR
jgi:S1-C subfamily serine protease